MKKRYTSEEQIIKRIDMARALSIKRNREADCLDAQADCLIRIPAECERAKLNRLEAKKKRFRAIVAEANAKKLGEKLSEFRTHHMSILPDNSIPV